MVNFENLVEKIAVVCCNLPVPVLVKEVGFGLSPNAVVVLNQAAVKIMDVDRAGGAWWSKIAPSIKKEILRNVGRCFVNCETATADTPAAARAAVPEASFVDSGGIRNGLEMAKAIALGADYVEWHSLFENERYNQNGNIPRVLYSSVSKIGNLYFVNYFTPYASLTKAFIAGVKLIISFTRP